MIGSDYVAVGRIGKAHGLRGEVAVEAWSDDPARRFAAGVVLRGGAAPSNSAPSKSDPSKSDPSKSDPSNSSGGADSTEFTIESARLHVDRWLVRFVGVEDRGAAERLRGTVLAMAARERPPIDDTDEYYDSDLVGLRAQDPGGRLIGVVTDVVHWAGGVHLVVTAADERPAANGQREHLVPFVAALVPVVDIVAGYVAIDAPDGLFEL